MAVGSGSGLQAVCPLKEDLKAPLAALGAEDQLLAELETLEFYEARGARNGQRAEDGSVDTCLLGVFAPPFSWQGRKRLQSDGFVCFWASCKI